MRQQPTNLQHEPPYPDEEGMVVFSMRSPDMAAHKPAVDCPIETPHMIDDCGLWSDEGGELINRAGNTHCTA